MVSKPAYPRLIYMKIPFRSKSWVLRWRYVQSEVGNFWSFVVGWIGREAPLMQKKWWRSSRSNKPEWKAKSEELWANSPETKHDLILPAISSCWLSSRNTRRWSSLSLVGKQLDWMFIPLVTAPVQINQPQIQSFLQPNSFASLDQPLQDLHQMKLFLRWDSHVEIHWNLYPGF